MSATTFVSPELKEAPEQVKDAEHSLPRNGNGGLQSTLPDSSVSVLEKLNEVELKAAIRSAWKMPEHVVKKDMAPLLFWLRLKLRAQGTRNDIHDKDRGFGAWVDENLDITRRTADRWADKYGLDNGLMERKPTSGHLSKSENKEFFAGILDEHKGDLQIAFNCWVKKAVHGQFTKALATIQKQFGLKDRKEAMVQGVIYAAKNVSARASTRSHASAHGGRNRGRRGGVAGLVKKGTGYHQPLSSANGHWGTGSSKVMRATAKQ
jgi:hypothetical protein